MADLVTPGLRIADIGTDHGYVPIYLVENGRNPSAVAMDINRGPLRKAEEHIALHGLSDYIETRLSDGVDKLKEGEADSVIIAGMGGGLVIRILSAAGTLADDVQEWILQPQSEIRKVRRYLSETGFRIAEENIVLDDGKYYPMMRVQKGVPEVYTEAELCYGKHLIGSRHPVLKQFLERELGMKKEILVRLDAAGSAGSRERTEEIKKEIEMIKGVLDIF